MAPGGAALFSFFRAGAVGVGARCNGSVNRCVLILGGGLLLGAGAGVSAAAEPEPAPKSPPEAGAEVDAGAATRLPVPVSGELSGRLQLEVLAGWDVPWRLEIRPHGLVAKVERDGLAAEVALRPLAGGRYGWELTRGEVDLGEFWPVLRSIIGEAASGWSASGRVVLAGAGEIDPEKGPVGEVTVTLRDGWARSDELDVELGGIELEVATTDFAGPSLPAGQTLRVRRLTMADMEATDFRLSFGLGADQVVRVAGGEVSLLGGRVNFRPVEVPLETLAVTAAAEVEGLQLSAVAELMPWLFQSAKGQLRGRVEIAWDEVKGLRLRDGGLRVVRDGEDATLRLAPSPGMLTGDMKDMLVSLFPNQKGWLRRIGLNNPAYAPLKDIEMGRAGLRVEEFNVTFRPDGAAGGRSANLHIVALPTSEKLVEKLVIDINFHGALAEAMAFGINQEFTGFDFRMQ